MKSIYLFLLAAIILIGCSINKQPSIQEKLAAPSQDYFIDANTDTLILGKEGTVIYIEKGSFKNGFGSLVTDTIQITLQEVYKTSDILKSNVTMRSGDKMLETGGMIELRAYLKGEQLSLYYNKSIVVHFPKKNRTDSMRLFYGNTKSDDDVLSSSIEWDLEESSVPKIISKIQPWYTKFEGVDDGHLVLADGTKWYDTLNQIFNLSEVDIAYFLNKTSKIKYEVNKKGELRYEEIQGSVITKEMKKKFINIAKNFPLCRPYSIGGQPIDMPGWFHIWSEVRPAKFLSNESYLKQIEEKMSSSDISKSAISVAELQYYIFDSKQLGWMNCDQFINPNPIKEDFVVSVPKSENIFVKIIFKNYKTIMIGDEKKGKFIFKDLPIDEEVKVVVIDEKDGKPLLRIIDTQTSGTTFKIEKVEPVTLVELQEKLKELD
jgi:hypothetical protein